MPLIFSYGSLQQPDVQQKTFGRLLDGHADQLPAFEPSLVPINDPEFVATSGQTHHANVTFNGNAASVVNGMVFDITDAELASVDAYETAFLYTRASVALASGQHAWVYVHTPVTPDAGA